MSEQPNHAVVDLDAFKYAAAYVGEKKSIRVVHKTEDWSEEYKSRTAFWGHYKKKAGGALAELNTKRDSPWLPEEFDIEDIAVPEPIQNVLHTAKVMVDDVIAQSGAKTYEMYMGKGDSFRVELSTLMKYKGNRDDLVKPYHLDEVTNFLARRYQAEFITGIEADDMVNIRCYKQKNHFAIGEDKDYWGCPINYLDINRVHRGIVDCNKLGKLFKDDKKYVRGEGRMHLYYQIISEDTVDNYKANCFSDIEWGSVSAFNTLVDCKTDKECFEAMVHTFKHLYPEPKVVQGWRGDDIQIDWLYVMQEMFNMAHMKRSVDEPVLNVKEILEKMKVVH
ncbi:hypothetical protein D3C75_539850 [compost metagenome]